jgi:hypothetical protein
MESNSIKTINRIAKGHSLAPFDFSKPISEDTYKSIHDLLDRHVKENREDLGKKGIAEIDRAFEDLAKQRKVENS